jgi:hypothetical protein
LTIFIVSATANHWWLDGIVATLLLCACAWLNAGVRAAWARRRVAVPPHEELELATAS